MAKIRTRLQRARAAAIMLVAAFALVFHGAFALMAHPLQHCNEHGRKTLSQVHTASIASHQHAHQHTAAPKTASATHTRCDHGAGKNTNTCCSTVAAATLPALQINVVNEIAVSRAGLVRAVTGKGYLPPTPAKPPRPTYQS